ncbi:MAG: dihydroorotate dehydrogenase electron transfer subunit [Bacteroidales bacterium]|nr:dihydroorotate dehydrogenase electron transfer subunit [Bacteroidales bacterium]
MRKEKLTILSNLPVAAAIWRLELATEDPGREVDGEFVHLSVPGHFLRRPLSLCEVNPGRITLLYKIVGEGTRTLASLPEGTILDALTDLGHGFHPEACRQEALLIGGGLGAAPLYLLARRLKAAGKSVTAVLGFNRVEEVVLDAAFCTLCDRVEMTTLDGSAGRKGFVTDALEVLELRYDYFYTCGPMVMMKAVCALLPGSGEASLEERMGCGCGICYGCSIPTAQGPRRVCADGPVFKKEDLSW